MVKAVADGKQRLVSIQIEKEVVDPDDVEMLQDLVTAAVGDAMTNARKVAEEKVGRVTGGLQIPGM